MNFKLSDAEVSKISASLNEKFEESAHNLYRRSCLRLRNLDVVPSPSLVPSTAPRVVIAFTGLAGAGKSTAAARLIKSYGFKRVRFVERLKAMMSAFGLTHEQIEGREKELPCDLLGGKSPRWAMQTLGTEWGRNLVSDDLWVRAWRAEVDRMPPGVSVVADDCRFPNEAEAVRALGGVIVKIERPGAGTASIHESEQYTLPYDVLLSNAGYMHDLQNQIDDLIRDISWAS